MEIINTIGTILTTNEHQRDAIHMAILPVVVDDDWIRPGEHVAFVPGSKDRVRSVRADGIGIIDPFLNDGKPLVKEDRVWLFLYPNTIHGLRHDWVCESIDGKQSVPLAQTVSVEVENSEEWIRSFADEHSLDYESLISSAARGRDSVIANDDFGRYDIDDRDYELFWHHLEVITGRKFDEDHRESVSWSCSC